MRTKISRFFIAGSYDVPIFTLDGITSEWLFVSGFWRKVNSALGTIFDQFEEDEAEPAVLGHIASELERTIGELLEQGEGVIRFVYRWTPDGEVYTLEISRVNLVSHLRALRDLFISAAARGDTLELSL